MTKAREVIAEFLSADKPWECGNEQSLADSILFALAEAGFVIVPVELFAQGLDYAGDYQDEGPSPEGWKSEGVKKVLAEAESLLSAANPAP